MVGQILRRVGLGQCSSGRSDRILRTGEQYRREMPHEPAQAFFHKTHIQLRVGARFEGGMKKNNDLHPTKEQVLDPTIVAMERMERYCAAHPGSPSAARRPQRFLRSQLWL